MIRVDIMGNIYSDFIFICLVKISRFDSDKHTTYNFSDFCCRLLLVYMYMDTVVNLILLCFCTCLLEL